MILNVDLIIAYLLQDDGYFGLVVDSYNKCTRFLGAEERLSDKEQFLQLKGGYAAGVNQAIALFGLFFAFHNKENAQLERGVGAPVGAPLPSPTPAPLTPFANFLLTEPLVGESQIWSNISGAEAGRRLEVLWSDQYPLRAFNSSALPIDLPLPDLPLPDLPLPDATPTPGPSPGASSLERGLVPREFSGIKFLGKSFVNLWYNALVGVDFYTPPKNGTLWTRHDGKLYGNFDQVENYTSTTFGLLSFLHDNNLYFSTEADPLSLHKMTVYNLYRRKTFYLYRAKYEVARNFGQVLPFAQSFLKVIAKDLRDGLSEIVKIEDAQPPVRPTKENSVCLEGGCLVTYIELPGASYREIEPDEIEPPARGSALTIIPSTRPPNSLFSVIGAVLAAIFTYFYAFRQAKKVRDERTATPIRDLCSLPLEERAKYYT